MVLGVVFLGVKAIEYPRSSRDHIVPGPSSPGTAEHPAAGDLLLVYFCMTGLHALHMIIGLGIMTWWR